jgi:hypothetical protein
MAGKIFEKFNANGTFNDNYLLYSKLW